mgnify:CR=1 FL=1
MSKTDQAGYTVAHKISSKIRAEKNGHRGAVIWLTGLSASGKSTLAMRVEQGLFERGRQVYVLDGDNIRRGLSSDLEFLPQDRSKNIRRIEEGAALFADAGVVVITAFVSPYSADRDPVLLRRAFLSHDLFDVIRKTLPANSPLLEPLT